MKLSANGEVPEGGDSPGVAAATAGGADHAADAAAGDVGTDDDKGMMP